jgi:hypothetical protein
MYHDAISQCIQAISAIETFLDKAERHARQRGFDANVFMNERLAPDMKPFVYQVQSASDYLKAGAAWLTGRKPPRYEDTEQTIEEVRARIHRTVEFAQSMTAEQYAAAGQQAVKLSWAPDKVLKGNEYLLQTIIPNVYFHVAMAYAILRNSGVDVGKMDFLGPIDFVDA